MVHRRYHSCSTGKLSLLAFYKLVPGMDKVNKGENHIVSTSTFVKEGIHDECDDACSICLEAFSHSDPSRVTICQHEFHLQCILEWCQRSSNCPMCWQPISLKDSTSQELLVAVEQERCFRSSPLRNAAMYHHPIPTLRGFGLQHVSLQSVQFNSTGMFPLIASENRSYLGESSSSSINRAGPSDFQSFPDTWRSRLNSMSMKYKESISENTRVWKEKLFSRSSSSMADIVSEVRTEISAGIATVSRMMERTSNGSNTASSAG
ncbi:RING-H2 group F2A [Perilla frutescens var. hirtella]|uniref:RING-type E3 ubiquitin transferase n=1 Tax=Perilla frutescens var. hirtella TaxID=608512 RepID=A0AAD4JBL4_PERFH|nr:RING-H2 group F2A [Perilla frutescens var. hirtella]